MIAKTAISPCAAVGALGALLEYPGEDFQDRYDAALAHAAELDSAAVASLREFGDEMARVSVWRAQEMYSRSFDLAPVCVPYVSVHLFGAESFKRAELMTGLNAAYEQMGFDAGAELPDHVALLLRAAPLFTAEEWRDLSSYVMQPALAKMQAALDGAESPWRLVIRAARQLIEPGETQHD